MTVLSINLNKVALIRNSREGSYPDVVEHAKVCIANGADGITVHPRPDQRHIRPDDVRRLAELVKPLESVEFNVEGNPFAPAQGSYPGFIQLVEETKPDQCTLVATPPADTHRLPIRAFGRYPTLADGVRDAPNASSTLPRYLEGAVVYM